MKRRVEAVGRWYEAFVTQRLHHISSSHGEIEDEDKEEEEEIVFEDDIKFLRSLDPKEWKVRKFIRFLLYLKGIGHNFISFLVGVFMPFCLEMTGETIKLKEL